jgi:hypothetical protein
MIIRNTLENAVDLKLWEMKPNDEGIQVAHFISEVTLRPGLNTVAADFWNAWCESKIVGVLSLPTSSLRVCGDQRRASSRLPASRRSITREKSSGMRSIAASSANKCSNSNHTGKPD